MICLIRSTAAALLLSLFPFNQIRSADTAASNRYRWPDGVIPYVIDHNIPRPERIYDALRQWVRRYGASWSRSAEAAAAQASISWCRTATMRSARRGKWR